MASITIIGLGPGDAKDLTREAWDILCNAETLYVRTGHHPVLAAFPETVQVISFDQVYERADSFAAVYQTIVDSVIDLGKREQGVLYAVPGHPFVGESTVTGIAARAKAQAIPVRIVPGLSFIEPMLTMLGLDALDGLQVFDALDVLALNHPPLNPDVPVLLGQVYSRDVVADLKLVLMNQYPDEHPVSLIDRAGTPQESLLAVPLYEMDHHPVSALTSLYVPPLQTASVTSFEGFQQTIAKLRAPDGCPWDREQTHESLRTNLLEESYEVLQAIDAGDVDGLCEELGDLLLQIVLHAQIAVEEGEFYMTEVIAAVDDKLKRRHPHVFADVEVDGVADVVTNWEEIKREERKDSGDAKKSMLDGIPVTLPSLARTQAYLDRGTRIGFHLFHDDPSEIQKSLHSALQALTNCDAGDGACADAFAEILLALSAWAGELQVDLESVLRENAEAFAAQFRALETYVHAHALDLRTLSYSEIEALWQSLL